jgi:HD-like signal output (HDOD) protein
MVEDILSPAQVARLEVKNIERQLTRCPALPSLTSINKALQGLFVSEQRYTAQIAEIIRRDPSLTSRLLRLVNSVYYGLDTPVNSIEEAVFYLGIRQIRQLATVTPLIEDFQQLTRQCAFPWREFWQHCIGTAILTREVAGTLQCHSGADESDYVVGLIHDVGKIVMAWTFPDHFTEIHRLSLQGARDLTEIETEILGMDHAELGARYLEYHRLPELMVNVARFHHHPEKAKNHVPLVACVHIADLLLRGEKIGFSGNCVPVASDQCFSASGWKVLFPNAKENENAIARASLSRTLELIPNMLEGLV